MANNVKPLTAEEQHTLREKAKSKLERLAIGEMKMPIIQLKHIYITSTDMGSRIDYEYSEPDLLKKYIKKDYLNRDEGLYVEIPGDASGIPEAILSIPFIGMMLTASMLLDLDIHVPVVERTFYDCLQSVRHVYKEMFPASHFNFNVTADSIQEINYESHMKATFFTGGVDATSALIENINLKPILLNIWGGDVRLTDPSSHQELETYFKQLSEALNLDYAFVKTDGREMWLEMDLDLLLPYHMDSKRNHDWWASIAHILSMTTTIAPFAYLQGIETCYIGSSYVDGTNIFDSNNEKLISAIRFGSTHFEGVDGQIDRLGKTKKIIDFHNSTGTNFQLKDCWNRVAGENCSNCEKCYRTIMGIVANGGKPNDFGFTVNNETFQRIKKMLKNSKVNEAFWIPIVDSFKANKSQWKDNPNLSWILHTKVNSPAVLAKKALRKIGIK